MYIVYTGVRLRWVFNQEAVWTYYRGVNCTLEKRGWLVAGGKRCLIDYRYWIELYCAAFTRLWSIRSVIVFYLPLNRVLHSPTSDVSNRHCFNTRSHRHEIFEFRKKKKITVSLQFTAVISVRERLPIITTTYWPNSSADYCCTYDRILELNRRVWNAWEITAFYLKKISNHALVCTCTYLRVSIRTHNGICVYV